MDSSKKIIIHAILSQLHNAIVQLQDWNKDVEDMHKLELSAEGMQRIAGNCMLIQAIGEGIKKIDKLGGNELFNLRPEIPWKRVMSMRDRISHGYFDIDVDYITDIINNDLTPLLNAIDYFTAVTEPNENN